MTISIPTVFFYLICSLVGLFALYVLARVVSGAIFKSYFESKAEYELTIKEIETVMEEEEDGKVF